MREGGEFSSAVCACCSNRWSHFVGKPSMVLTVIEGKSLLVNIHSKGFG